MSEITLSGKVLEVERKSGEFEGRPYDFHVAHVLVGRKVVEVRYNPDNRDAGLPAQDAVIVLEIELPKGVRPVARAYVSAPAVKSA